MSLVRLVPARLHGALADYGGALALLLVPWLLASSTEAIASGVVLGLTVLLVSLFTKYPLGVFRVIPFPVHSAGDYLGSIATIAAPYALGFNRTDPASTTFFLALGIGYLIVSLMTDYKDPAATRIDDDRPIDVDRRTWV